ncbi:MAG: IS110 family transposase [Cyanobacteria bacterium 13_1_40CM_2_61_4]|nr:MAG: IS110 family transposase [Cyanobacteria bacterium 13_1_40CM_2_61_4]
MALTVLYARCAGLDVHKLTVVACILLTAPSGQVSQEVRTFTTTTAGLQALSDWLASYGVTHVAMESTGIYWRPVFNLLESRFEVILVNAQHMKAIPGHKTDIKDSEWIAQLLSHGLLKASFIPPKPIRDLRDLLRSRKTLVQERAQAINRVQKVLETANIKLSSVATDVLGKSGRDMLEALLAGVGDADSLAQLARGRLRAKLPALREALDGRVEATHRVLLRHLLDLIDFLQGQLDRLSAEIDQLLVPYEGLIARLMQIPGIGRMAAATIVAELGTDMSRFPSAKHLASWAGVAPGNKQSGGKRLRAATTKGNTHLRAVLAEVVWVISHTKDTYLSAQYHRLARRLGKKKAIVAVSHSVLTIIYHLLRTGQDYHDLGPHFFETLDTTRQRDTAVRRLEALGYKVILEEKKEVPA